MPARTAKCQVTPVLTNAGTEPATGGDLWPECRTLMNPALDAMRRVRWRPLGPFLGKRRPHRARLALGCRCRDPDCRRERPGRYPIGSRETGHRRSSASRVTVIANTALRLIVVCSVLLLATVLGSAQADEPRRQVRVGVEQYPPLTFFDQDGTARGLAVDILEAVAKRNGWRLAFVPGEFSELLNLLEGGNIDLLLVIARTEDRARRYRFSEESYITNWAMIYQRPGAGIQGLFQLESRAVAIVKKDIHGSALLALAIDFDISFEPVPVGSYDAAMMAIESERVDAAVVSRLFGLANERKYDVEPTSVVLNPVELRFAAPASASGEVLAAVDAFLREQKAEKSSLYHQSVLRWTGQKSARHIPDWIVRALAATVALVVLGAALSIVFRVQVRRKTQELAAQNVRIRGILDGLTEGVITIDESGVVESANPAVTKIFGYRPDEVCGQNVNVLMRSPDATQHDGFVENYLRANEDKTFGVGPLELTGVRKDGTTFPVEISISEMRLNGRRLFIGVVNDVSERVETQRQLQQALKMEAVGNLTGGIAHDFNNMLAVILGNLQLLQRRTKDDIALRKIISSAIDATKRGAELTGQLLAFSRRQELEPKVLDINALVASTQTMLRRTLGEQIDIRTTLAEDIGYIEADPAHLESAILNLAINARDAMPEGGRLVIETSNVELNESYVKANPYAKTGPHVCVSVTDTGGGIPKEIRDQIFEPFFTTKEVGKGTGLGLSMVYGFVKQSGGHINVYSEDGHGTRFRLYFPRIEEMGAPVALDRTEEPVLLTGSETVLVVEDDVKVREITALLLEDLGYTVIGEADGPSALRALETESKIDLLFSDMIMPGGMTGHLLAERALTLRPEIKVLLTSGYSHGSFEDVRMFPILSKPYTDDELARTIRHVLNVDGRAAVES